MVTNNFKKNHLLNFFIIFSLIISHVLILKSQDINVSAKVDSNNFLIGDWIRLHVEIKYSSELKIIYPTVVDSIEGLEFIERSQIITNKKGNQIHESFTYTFTSFDTGTYVIPPLNFIYFSEKDTTKKVASSAAIPIFVHKIGVDPTKDIKDIKPPLNIPISIFEIIKYTLIALIIIVVLFVVYYVYKHKKEKNILEVFKTPKRPAHEVALDALKVLESERLWQRGEIKLYHSKLTDIIRAYIEERFGIKALEETTDEIIKDFREMNNFNGDLLEKLKEILVRADLVKFAKAQPPADENEKSLCLAYEFVTQTIPTEKIEEIK